MAKTKWYAVAKGRSGPAIYTSWDECKEQTLGFSGAIYKSFKTREEAQTFIRSNAPGPAAAAATSSASAPSSNMAGKKRTRDAVNDASQNKRSSNHQQQTSNNKNDASVQITIHFDGGSRGNPGIAGAGAEVVIIKNTTPLIITKYLIRQFCGMRETNNHAEYQGLISGLEHARTLLSELTEVPSSVTSLPSSMSKPLFNLQVFGDSNLIIQQLRGNWQCKNDNIRPLYLRCQRLIHEIRQIDKSKSSNVSFDHIYREQNKIADQLANEAMDQRRSWMTNESSGGNDAENNARSMKVGEVNVGVAAAAAAAQRNKEVIDVDDDSSDHSC